ncbi:hypothetical protein ACQP2T_13430 [Nonomuraea sp. CA-143628]|uniref:hypothetical protein n=1 Tax=Nonomuraea sp. CA-143628 TaxID=3239997 RepID=UPI003D945D83
MLNPRCFLTTARALGRLPLMAIDRCVTEWRSWADTDEWTGSVERARELVEPYWRDLFSAHWMGPDALAATIAGVLVVSRQRGKSPRHGNARDVWALFDRMQNPLIPNDSRPSAYEVLGTAVTELGQTLQPATAMALQRLWETVLLEDNTPTPDQWKSLAEESFVRCGLAVDDVAGPVRIALERSMAQT